MLSRRDIEVILFDEVERRKSALVGAQKDFTEFSGDIPSGLPHPDGVLRIRNAGSRQSAALKAYSQALLEFNKFIVHGEVPERLKAASSPRPKA
jgi:hypothetical protein